MSEMEPFYFGRRGVLFGVFHAALGAPRGRGVLIAGPLLNEGIRCHFTLREIAIRCAGRGFDVLRFDYAGLGNSQGSPLDHSLADWIDNIEEAARELTAISGSRSLGVVAVRFAANLVEQLVARRDVRRLVAWDPIVSGAHWLEHLREARRNLPAALRGDPREAATQLMGHAVGSTLMDEVGGRGKPALAGTSFAAVVTEHYRHVGTLMKLTKEVREVAFDCRWQDHTSDVLYFPEVIEAVCQQLG